MKTRNINKGSEGFKVSPEKYELMKKMILKALPKNSSGITFAELVSRVKSYPESTEFNKPMWYTKVVQLDLEARGLAKRNNEKKVLRFYKVK